MYGLGIRLGYYLQWYGGISASVLAPQEAPGAGFALGLFVSATFLALVIQTVLDNLQVVEIYVILLLTFGAYISIVPLMLWRLITGCQPLWDPTRFPPVDRGATNSDLHSLLLLAVIGFQLWHWITRVPSLECRQYGFVFAKVPLQSRAFQIVNVILSCVLCAAVLVLASLRLKDLAKDPKGQEARTTADTWMHAQEAKCGQHWLHQRVRRLRALNCAIKSATASVVVVATELTIHWNHISNVSSLSSAGQLIPFAIGLGTIVRVLYVWVNDYVRSGSPAASVRPRSPRPIPADELWTVEEVD